MAVFQPTDVASTVTFTSVDDAIPEPMEVFPLRIVSTHADVVLGALNTAAVALEANDNAAGIFSFLVQYP